MMERFVTCSMPLLICVLSTGCNGFQAPVPLGLNQLLKRSYLTDRQDYNETADPFLYSGAEPEQEITGRTGLGDPDPDSFWQLSRHDAGPFELAPPSDVPSAAQLGRCNVGTASSRAV